MAWFKTQKECEEQDALKMQYQYWDEWTGARFARRENSYMDKEYFDKHHRLYSNGSLSRIAHKEFCKNVKIGEVIRSNPVTGNWEPI